MQRFNEESLLSTIAFPCSDSGCSLTQKWSARRTARGSRERRVHPKLVAMPFVSDSTWSTSRASCFGGSALFLAAVVRVALNWCLNRTAATPPQDRVQIFQGPEERALDWILASAHWSQTTGTHLDWDGSHRDSTATATTTQPHCSRGQQNRDSDGGLFQMPENDGCRGGASALFPSCHRNTVLLVPSKY